MAFIHGPEVVELETGTRPIRTMRSSVIGIAGTAPNADAAAFPVDTPVLVTTGAEAAKLDPVGDGLGTLPAAMEAIRWQVGTFIVVVRVEEGLDDAETETNIIGGVNATTGDYEGIEALLGAASVVGVEPRILCAPGFTGSVTRDIDQAITGKPVADKLLTVADKLRAIAVIDGPDTTDDDATTFTGLFDTPRAYIVDPGVKGLFGGVEQVIGGSAFAAGVIARTDLERGWWWSPSNRVIAGVVGLNRPIDFKLGEPTSRANLLNENNVATVINQDGYRLWGNRTPATTDPRWQFLSVRRTADVINDSLLAAHLWAVDRGITATYVEDVTGGVNAFLRDLTGRGAILGGSCWADPDLNTPSSIEGGAIFFDFDFTPVYPAERVVFRSALSDAGLEELFA